MAIPPSDINYSFQIVWKKICSNINLSIQISSAGLVSYIWGKAGKDWFLKEDNLSKYLSVSFELSAQSEEVINICPHSTCIFYTNGQKTWNKKINIDLFSFQSSCVIQKLGFGYYVTLSKTSDSLYLYHVLSKIHSRSENL